MGKKLSTNNFSNNLQKSKNGDDFQKNFSTYYLKKKHIET